MLPHWSARGLENAAYSKFFATQRNAAYFQNRILAIASARRLLRNRISGGKKRRLITSSPVNSMETQLRIRAAVYPLSLSSFSPSSPPPPPNSLTPSMSTASRIRNRKLVTRPTVFSEGGVYPSGYNFINLKSGKKFPLPWIKSSEILPNLHRVDCRMYERYEEILEEDYFSSDLAKRNFQNLFCFHPHRSMLRNTTL